MIEFEAFAAAVCRRGSDYFSYRKRAVGLQLLQPLFHFADEDGVR